MAATYIGFFRNIAQDVVNESLRTTGSFPPAMIDKVVSFPASLPATCKHIGTWTAAGGEVPGVIIVEAEASDLEAIGRHYAGWLAFDWHPSQSPSRDRSTF